MGINTATFTQIVGVNMLPNTYESKPKKELLEMVRDLRNEALGWRNRVCALESKIRGLEIALDTEQERSRLLAIENVQLLNKTDPEKMRQYANELSDDEPVSNHGRKRHVSDGQPLHPGAGRVC